MSKKHTRTQIIEKFISVHGSRYDYSEVIYTNYSSKVKIICKLHGEFFQSPEKHILRKQGCPECGKTKKLTTTTFIKKANAKHDFTYDYSDVVYVSSKDRVSIRCKEHGLFWQTPANHLMGQGCSKCMRVGKPTDVEFIEKANLVHGGRYSYPRLGYVNVSSKITITCATHGDFEQVANAHLCGTGCPECNGGTRYTLEKFIVIANEVHQFKYDYSKVEYKNKETRVIITCKEHGDFEQTPGSHMQGCGCKSCAEYGFNPSKQSILYLFKINESILGFGITNDFKTRHGKHKANFLKHSATHELIATYECSGHQALAIENHLKQTYEIIDTGIEGFRKEATAISNLPAVLEDIKNLIDTYNYM